MLGRVATRLAADLQRRRDAALEREIGAIAGTLQDALDRREYRRALVLWADLRAAIARRSPAQVRRLEQARGLVPGAQG